MFDNSPVQAPPPPSLAQSISNLLTPGGLRSKRTPPPCDKKNSPLPLHRLSDLPSPHSHPHTPRNRQSVSSDNYQQDHGSPHSSRRRQSDEEEDNPLNLREDHRIHRRRKSEEILTASPRNLFRSTSTSSLFAESQPHMFYHNSCSPSSSSRKSSIAWEPPEQVSPSSRGVHRPSLPLPPPTSSTIRRHGTQRKSSFTLNGRIEHGSSPSETLQNGENFPHHEEVGSRPREEIAVRSISADKVRERDKE